MATADTIILHQYQPSPFSAKLRAAMGLKGLPWANVEIPMAMPKPDLMPLTGGYRKTPVMQIGADIYCDTKIIFDELEARHPEPSFFPGRLPAMSHMMGRHCDGPWFQATVALIFGQIGDMMPEDFRKDREGLMGSAFDTRAMAAAAPLMREQIKVNLTWLDQQLADGRDFLEGGKPGLSDLHGFMNLWFLGNTVPQELEPVMSLTLSAWQQRIAALGEGTPTPLAASEALAIAKAATPSVTGDGPQVSVMADDYGKDPVSGRLAADTAERTVIVRDDDQVGEVAVHFPKAGFMVVRS